MSAFCNVDISIDKVQCCPLLDPTLVKDGMQSKVSLENPNEWGETDGSKHYQTSLSVH